MAKYDNGERYLEEINHVSVLESVDEVFDSATSIMTPNAVMYGSTVTALITGLPICADLDIAVSNQEFMTLCKNFASSVKWIQTDGKRIPERKASDFSHKFELPSSGISPATPGQKVKNPYAEAKHLPISKMVAFEAVNNNRVQIVESKTMTGDRLDDALEVVRKVDFTFCGIAIDRYGRVLEVIPHAYDDCRRRIIRIQNYQPLTDPACMKERLYKYIRRGWGLTMSIDQAMANLDKAKREHAKKLSKKSKRKKPRPISLFTVKKNSRLGYVLETKPEVRRMIGSNSLIISAAKKLANKHFDTKLESTIDARGHLIFWVHSKTMSGTIARELTDMISEYLSKRYKIDYNKVKTEDKMRKMGKMYAKKPMDSSSGSAPGGYASEGSTSTSGTYSMSANKYS